MILDINNTLFIQKLHLKVEMKIFEERYQEETSTQQAYICKE